jgi:hypothetical protein
VISKGGVTVHEEVVEFEPANRMSYRVIKGGFPMMADHLGEVSFSAVGQRTRIVWRCRFRSSPPGCGMLRKRVVHRVFADTLTSLEAYDFSVLGS